eukprot:gene24239-9838_t
MSRKSALTGKRLRYSALLLLGGLAIVSFLSFSSVPEDKSTANVLQLSEGKALRQRRLVTSVASTIIGKGGNERESFGKDETKDEGQPELDAQEHGGVQVQRSSSSSMDSSSSSSSRSLADEPLRLIIASHNRLLWYYPDTDETKVHYVHYGVIPGAVGPDGSLRSLWNVIRPHNYHPVDAEEFLIELDAETGEELTRVKLQSRFTHDAARAGDKVYICNTDGGEIQQLSYPDMQLVKKWPLFSLKQHMNTLAPLDEDEIWVVLHNLGKSDIVRVELCNCTLDNAPPSIDSRIREVGMSSHGLVRWNDNFIVLDSQNGALVKVDPGTLSGLVQWSSEAEHAKPEVLWKWSSEAQHAKPEVKAPEGGKFLKGLTVVDDIAYFGISVFSNRAARGDPTMDSEVGAFDLLNKELLWRRTVPTKRSLNIVAPTGSAGDEGLKFVGQGLDKRTASGAVAMTTELAGHSLGGATAPEVAIQKFEETGDVRMLMEQLIASTEALAPNSGTIRTDDDEKVGAISKRLVELGFPAHPIETWPSGLPRLSLASKNTRTPWTTGIQVPLSKLDIKQLKEVMLRLPDKMWDEIASAATNALAQGREGNMAAFKPGCGTLWLVFSDQSTDNSYRFPYYYYFQKLLEPLLTAILGEGGLTKISRMQFAKIPSGGFIKIHADQGGFAHHAHRIHVPISTNQNVTFEMCPDQMISREKKKVLGDTRRRRGKETSSDGCVSIPMVEGVANEINNVVTHRVLNTGCEPRIQWVIDVVEQQVPTYNLRPGAECGYSHGVVSCKTDAFADPKMRQAGAWRGNLFTTRSIQYWNTMNDAFVTFKESWSTLSFSKRWMQRVSSHSGEGS